MNPSTPAATSQSRAFAAAAAGHPPGRAAAPARFAGPPAPHAPAPPARPAPQPLTEEERNANAWMARALFDCYND